MAGNFDKLEVIGSGTFGRVWLARAKSTLKKYVIKEIQVSGMDEKYRDQTLTEVSVLARCRHWNVIRYKDAFVHHGYLNIVMEYAEGGDLHRVIKNQKETLFPEAVILDWFVQVCFAIRYIHGQNILHRDLKTQNIFLTGDKVIKVGDFGISRVLEHTDDHAKTAIGTPYYLSPEICQRMPYNYKSDMWAAGCVLYEMTTLNYAFEAPNFAGIVLKIMEGKFKPIASHYGPLLHDLINVLLRVNPERRPSAEQILCIPAVQTYVDAYIKRQNSVFEKRKSIINTPEFENRKEIGIGKENIAPKQQTRPRKHSLSTPKADTRVTLKERAASVTSSKDKQQQVSGGPKISLYHDLLEKRARKNSVNVLPNEVPAKRVKLTEDTKPVLMNRHSSKGLSMRKGKENDTVKEKDEKSNTLQREFFSSKTYTIDTKSSESEDVKMKIRCSETYTVAHINVTKDSETNAEEKQNVENPMQIANDGEDYKGVVYPNDDVFTEGCQDIVAKDTVVKVTTKQSLAKKQHGLDDSDPKMACKLCTKSHYEIAEILYDTSVHVKNQTFTKTETLCSYLENKLGVSRFVTVYKSLKEAIASRMSFESLKNLFTDSEVVYFPLFFHLLQLEGHLK